MYIVKRFIGGQRLEFDDNSPNRIAPTKSYGVVNPEDKIITINDNLCHLYDYKYIAQWECDKLNSS